MKSRVLQHAIVPPYARAPFALDIFNWVGDFNVPPLGEDLIIRVNGISRAKVGGYATHNGFLGVMPVPYSLPDWWVCQNGPPSLDNAALVFGAEISRARITDTEVPLSKSGEGA